MLAYKKLGLVNLIAFLVIYKFNYRAFFFFHNPFFESIS